MRLLPLLLLAALPATAAPQLDLTIDNTGLSIGDSRIVRGIRFNVRDRRMEQVDGVNVTVWSPHRDARGGEVNGLALGLPMTGARRIQGIGVGILGVGAEEGFTGIGIGGAGIGSGGDVRGILIGGLGVGAGGDVTGLTVGVLGAGAGGDISGITVGGLGAGTGGNVRGITVAGLGAGAGGDVTGLTIALLGAGAGGDITGITIAPFAGSGGTLRGVAAGVAAGAPTVRALLLSAAAGGHDVRAAVFAPIYFRVAANENGGDGGMFRGVSVSSFNHVQGDQRGLTIGVFNSAWTLDGGWQIGLSNYVRNQKRGPKWLPIINREW